MNSVPFPKFFRVSELIWHLDEVLVDLAGSDGYGAFRKMNRVVKSLEALYCVDEDSEPMPRPEDGIEFESELSDEFIEKQLRDKLGLAKKGEIILILPDEETLKKRPDLIR